MVHRLDFRACEWSGKISRSSLSSGALVVTLAMLLRLINCLIIIFYALGINVPGRGLKKLEKMKRLGMSKIPCGHKRAYFHVEEQH